MKRCRRLFSRIILLSFVLRALVPMGLMLQLPVLAAEEASNSDFSGIDKISFGFVICPIQNPGIDLALLVDDGQTADQHTHHHKHHQNHGPSDDYTHSAVTDNQEHNTVSVDRGASLCHLWSSSEHSSLLATNYSKLDFPERIQPLANPIVALYQSNHFPSRLTRAPPQNL